MKLAEREPLDLDCVAGMTRSQWFFRISKCVSWRRHPFGGLNTGMVRTWRELGAGRMASALQKISSRVRAKNARGPSWFPLQKNLRKNFPAHALGKTRRLAKFITKSKSETVAQIASAGDDAGNDGAFGLGSDERINQIKLIHRHELKNFAADFALLVARQILHHL